MFQIDVQESRKSLQIWGMLWTSGSEKSALVGGTYPGYALRLYVSLRKVLSYQVFTWLWCTKSQKSNRRSL